MQAGLASIVGVSQKHYVFRHRCPHQTGHSCAESLGADLSLKRQRALPVTWWVAQLTEILHDFARRGHFDTMLSATAANVLVSIVRRVVASNPMLARWASDFFKGNTEQSSLASYREVLNACSKPHMVDDLQSASRLRQLDLAVDPGCRQVQVDYC